MAKKNIVLIATLDTKGKEALFVKRIIENKGHNVLVLDTGLLSKPLFKAGISRENIAEAGGKEIGVGLEEMKSNPQREISNKVMGNGAAKIVKHLFENNKVDGVISIGGGQGTAIGTTAMRSLPIGVPKVMLSTIASGNTRPYVDIYDITMMHSVVDIAGLNFISKRILANAANAICGMVEKKKLSLTQKIKNLPKLIIKRKSVIRNKEPIERNRKKRRIAISMYGTTTPCVMKASEILENNGFETVKFHASGIGGKAMEHFIKQGKFDGVLDITLAEITNNIIKGFHNAGETRMEAASEKGLPQVIVPGAVEFFVQGAKETVPKKYLMRKHVAHSTKMMLIHTTTKEVVKVADVIAEKLKKAKSPALFIMPKASTSFYSQKGQAFYAPKHLQLFAERINSKLKMCKNSNIIYEEYDLNINDPKFGEILAEKMICLIEDKKFI